MPTGAKLLIEDLLDRLRALKLQNSHNLTIPRHAPHQLIVGGVSLAGGGAHLHHLLLHGLVHVRVTNHRITRANKFLSCLTPLFSPV